MAEEAGDGCPSRRCRLSGLAGLRGHSTRPRINRVCARLPGYISTHYCKEITRQVHRSHRTLFSICTSLPLTTLAAGSITIAKQAPYTLPMSAPDAVVCAKCNLPGKVSEYVKEFADKTYDKAQGTCAILGRVPRRLARTWVRSLWPQA